MLSRLYGVLLPFFVSFLLAYLLDPLVGFVQHKCRVRFRGLAVMITLALFTALLTLAVYLVIPAMGREIKVAAEGVEQYFANFDANKYLTEEQQQRLHDALDGLNLESLLSYPEVRDGIKDMIPRIGGWITGGLGWLSELVVIVVGLMYLVFLLAAFPAIRAGWSRYVPPKYLPQAKVLVHEINNNMNAYFRGQGLVALCVGVLFAAGFTIIGMPMGLAMGIIIGILNLVPYMQAIGIPPCILLCIVQSAQTGQPVWLTILMMALVFVVVQTLQDMVLVPKIMGKVTGLGPAAILLSLSVWGALMGVIGMIVALPLTTLALACYRHYVLHEPFPSEQNRQTENNIKTTDAMKTIYNFKSLTSKGTELDFSKFEGKVLIVVNTASKCGFTPQFQGLEELYKKYKDQGLAIVGFPCNQFKEQDPGSDNTIEEFCRLNYGVTFQIMKKTDVNGENAEPLFDYLKQQAPEEEYKGLKAKAAKVLFRKISDSAKNESDIQWNFTKFLISKDGKTVKRFAPTTEPKDMEKDIETMLAL